MITASQIIFLKNQEKFIQCITIRKIKFILWIAKFANWLYE